FNDRTLLSAGVGFVMSCCEYISHAILGEEYANNGFVASIGVLRLLADWQRTIETAVGSDGGDQLNALLRDASGRQRTPWFRRPFPFEPYERVLQAALLIPYDTMRIRANSFGLSISFGAHLLNRVLPTAYSLYLAAGRPGLAVSWRYEAEAEAY